MDAGSLFVDFENRQLHLTGMPYNDWLARSENAYFARRLRSRNEFSADENGQHAEWCLDLEVNVVGDKFLKKTTEALELMDELCENFGLDKGEVQVIAKFMLELWQEVEVPKQGSRKRKRETTTRMPGTKRKLGTKRKPGGSSLALGLIPSTGALRISAPNYGRI